MIEVRCINAFNAVPGYAVFKTRCELFFSTLVSGTNASSELGQKLGRISS
jgi:hypothetical protein